MSKEHISLQISLLSFPFSAVVRPHLHTDTHPWEEVWALGSTWKERATGQELWFGPDGTKDTASFLIGAVKRVWVCERVCVCASFEPYLKCENTSRINVRLQYVWRDLIFILKSSSPPHMEANILSWQPLMSICPCWRVFRCKLRDPPRGKKSD